jgi:chaperone modulatory protein CbpM
MAGNQKILTGEVLDERVEYDLEGLCQICRLERRQVVEMIVENVVEPAGEDPEHWRFTGAAVTRIQVAARLTRDLGINTAGAALALELLDEIERLRAALHRRS